MAYERLYGFKVGRPPLQDLEKDAQSFSNPHAHNCRLQRETW